MKATLRVIIALAVILVASSQLFAQDSGVPDTIYYGEDGKAYGYPGGIFRIPVYITTDQEISSLSFGIEFGLPGGVEPTWDSLSDIGTIFELGDYFEIGHLMYNDVSINGGLPDTLCVGGAALMNFLPPGSYKYCDVWFSGGEVGESVMIDTAWSQPACDFAFQPAEGSVYAPQFVGGLLTIEPGGPGMSLTNPDTISVDAGALVTFEIGAFSYYPPITVQLDSLVRMPDGVYPIDTPQTSGSNPLTFEWTPDPYEGGTVWLAYFTATDALTYTVETTVQIGVYAAGLYYGLIGDTNCDGIIDIDDAVFLINYIFASGPAPTCE